MDIYSELKNRQIIKEVTNLNKFKKLKKGEGIYIGFDPSESSLHLGNYFQITLLKRFKNFGFRCYALIGGATGMIGDPSGKTNERQLLDIHKLTQNKQKIVKQLKFFDINVIDNFHFYANMNVLDFLRIVGKHINVSYLLSKDFIKTRLKSGLSFTEFSYQLIQGWDFRTMYQKYKVKIQAGASDQWGNITTGLELIRKTIDQDHDALGIMTELLVTSDGKKFGKTENNALWIDKTMTNPYQLYQYLLNIEDKFVHNYLLWLTFLEVKTIEKIMVDHKKYPHKKVAQRTLAFEVVKDIHSDQESEVAQKISDVLFGQEKIESLSTKQVLSLTQSVPTIDFAKGPLIDALIASGAATSKRQARELITEKAIEVNGNIVNAINYYIKPSLFNKKVSVIKKGKRSFFILKHR